MGIDLGSVIFDHSSSFILLKEIEILFKDMYMLNMCISGHCWSSVCTTCALKLQLPTENHRMASIGRDHRDTFPQTRKVFLQAALEYSQE